MTGAGTRGDVLADRAVVVCCAHGESVHYPLADIAVQIAGRKLLFKQECWSNPSSQQLFGSL